VNPKKLDEEIDRRWQRSGSTSGTRERGRGRCATVPFHVFHVADMPDSATASVESNCMQAARLGYICFCTTHVLHGHGLASAKAM